MTLFTFNLMVAAFWLSKIAAYGVLGHLLWTVFPGHAALLTVLVFTQKFAAYAVNSITKELMQQTLKELKNKEVNLKVNE